MNNISKYNFPRVNTTLQAKTRRQEVVIENPRVPVLFAVVVADKGPYEVTKVRNIEELEFLYGKLDYYKQGQDVLNLYQWLGGNVPYNGYAWIKRIEPAFINDENGTKTYKENFESFGKATGEFDFEGSQGVGQQTGNFKLTFTARDSSPIFSKYTIKITQIKDRLKGWTDNIAISVYNEKGILVSELTSINGENYKDKLKELDYFNVEFDGEWISSNEPVPLFGGNRSINISLEITGGDKQSGLTYDLKIDEVFEAIEAYYSSYAREELEDMLSYPISIILDGNYPVSLKQEIIEFIGDVRDDVHFMLSRTEYQKEADVIIPELILTELNSSDYKGFILNNPELKLPETGNIAVWAPDYLRVQDGLLNNYVVVSSIYSLASKIPENDFKYGIWWNFVGPRRGLVYEDVINTNTPFDKEKYTSELTNYIEKTHRDQAFMLQRTTGKKNTAYVQLHASRLTQYLRREIRWIARNYLFEYNDIDSTTYIDVKNEIKNFLNQFASIAIDMSNPYKLEVYKTGENRFQIAITNLKYKDVVETIDLLIQLD